MKCKLYNAWLNFTVVNEKGCIISTDNGSSKRMYVLKCGKILHIVFQRMVSLSLKIDNFAANSFKKYLVKETGCSTNLKIFLNRPFDPEETDSVTITALLVGFNAEDFNEIHAENCIILSLLNN